MKLVGTARLGKDAEVRYTPAGKAVAGLSLAWNYGQKGQDGNRPSQWVEASIWGEQAERMGQYLTKGVVLDLVIRDVHIETYNRKDGSSGSKLVGTVAMIDFAPSQPKREDSYQHPEGSRPLQPRQQSASAFGGGAAFDDDIPFAPKHYLEG